MKLCTMFWLYILFTFTSFVFSADAGCTITQYSQVSSVLSSCTDIVINNLSVPKNKMLNLNLKDGTKLTFKGTTKFEKGSLTTEYLMSISGKRITVKGEKGAIIHGNGEHYWDGDGIGKPRLLSIDKATDSVIENLYLKNCPSMCTGIHHANNLKIEGFTADCAEGDDAAHKGRNTDGIGISHSTNVEINNAFIHNQDQCLYVNSGTNMRFSNIHCVNSNGICATAGFSETSVEDNTTKNITFHNCVMEGGLTGVQIIAMAKPGGGPGEVSDITFQNVLLKGIHQQGIFIETDYGNAGHPNNNLDVKNIKFSQIHGTVDSRAKAVKIRCSKKCSNIVMSNINITGSKVANECNYKPTGFNC